MESDGDKEDTSNDDDDEAGVKLTWCKGLQTLSSKVAFVES